MARTLSQVDTALASIETRVTALDGVGATNPSLAEINDLKKDIRGLTTTLRQVTLQLESELKNLRDRQTALETLVNGHLD